MLTDGIFAIALTLLVLTIQVPVTHTLQEFNNLFDFNSDFYTNTRSYIITFAVLISYWKVHRRLMNNLERINSTFISINAVFLAFVAFFPVTNSLLRDSQFPGAVIIYTVVLVVVTVLNILGNFTLLPGIYFLHIQGIPRFLVVH